MLELPSKPHITQLNIIRAIAALLVTMYHLGGKNLPFLSYGWLGVQMFFVLSGFVICYSLPENFNYQQFGKFITKRLIRIEPPYLISIVLILLFGFILAILTQKIYLIDSKNLLFHFAYLNNFFENEYLSPVYWTLGIEFQFYILIGLLFPLFFQNKFVFAAIIVVLSLIPVYFDLKYNTIITHFPLFAIGIGAFFYKKSCFNIYITFLLIIFTLIVTFYAFNIENTLAAFFALVVIILPLKSNLIIDFFAKISFSLYLTHDLVGSQLVIFLGNLFDSKNLLTKAFSFSIGLTVAVVFAYFFYLCIEKPFLKLSKKLKY